MLYIVQCTVVHCTMKKRAKRNTETCAALYTAQFSHGELCILYVAHTVGSKPIWAFVFVYVHMCVHCTTHCIQIDWVGQDAQSGLFVGVNRTDRGQWQLQEAGSLAMVLPRVKENYLWPYLYVILCAFGLWLRSYLKKFAGAFGLRQIVFECTTSISDKQSHVNGKGG